MFELSRLPALNAFLNFASAVFLLLGFVFIKRKHITAHRLCMGVALVFSALFFASYVYYHLHVGHTRFAGTGWVRTVYFFILVTHVVLAAAIVPLVLTTLFLALAQRFDRHRAWARWTWPLWMYVSVTGVVIYMLLYRWAS